jgi:Ca-activated chloride channel homolog
MATPLSGWRALPVQSLLLLVGTGISLGAPGDPPEFTYRTNVSEVRLSFSALDQNNHGVATLQPGDFAIVDKGFIVRNFQSFNRSDWTKLDLVILIDSSESVTPHFRQEIADTLELVSQTAGVPDESLSIISFHDLQTSLVCAGDCRASHVADQLPAARAGGLTPLFDSIVFATDFLSHHGDAHAGKVVILFSDGQDTISRYSLTDAIDAAQMTDIQIYCIDLGKSASSQGAAVLYGLAGATGGRYFLARDGATRALNLMLEGFRSTYTVSYRLPNHASGFHTVQILPTHKLDVQFRSRSGYYYPNHVR